MIGYATLLRRTFSSASNPVASSTVASGSAATCSTVDFRASGTARFVFLPSVFTPVDLPTSTLESWLSPLRFESRSGSRGRSLLALKIVSRGKEKVSGRRARLRDDMYFKVGYLEDQEVFVLVCGCGCVLVAMVF